MRNSLAIILLFSFIAVFAQTKTEQKADDLFQIYYFDKAIKKYKKADTLSMLSQKRLAESYYNRFDFSNAEIEYEKFINTPIASIEDLYKYVLILKANKKYDVAGYWMEKIAQDNPSDLRVKSFWETNSDFQKILKPNPTYSIRNLTMNTTDEDFGTVYYKKKQVVFASTRSGSKPILRKYNWNREPFLDIFIADKVDSNELVKPKHFNKKYNKKWHEGPSSFKSNGKFLAFTKNNYENMSEDGIVKLQIFFSEYKKREWQEPTPFYLNSNEYSVGHPALTRNAKIMFFVSDMPGGYGGTDIYMVSKLSKNKWSKPINLGPKINTEGNEMFPFYEDRNKLLFYSSNGKHGLGGLDVYVGHATSLGFEDIKNIGAPINTSADDFAFIIDRKLKTGYFSSNREGGKGGDDIYSFDFTGKYEMKKKVVAVDSIKSEPESEKMVIRDSVVHYSYSLLVLNDETSIPIMDAQVQIGTLLMHLSDEVNPEDSLALQMSDSLGAVALEFDVADSFKVVVNAFGYKQEEKLVSIDQMLADEVTQDTVRLKVAYDEAIVLKNIYYDFDKSDILPESEVELNKVVKFMKENPKLELELSSHTDSRGSDEYNMGLSQRRANSAVKYVISEGIQTTRITAKGYGETRPVNKCVNGVRCYETEHRQNRRTEIFIPGFGKALDIKQTKGLYSK